MRRALLGLLAACHPGAPATTDPDHTPRLVVLMVVDQCPEWAFEQKRPALHGGFDRLLRDGTWHVGQHPSAATLTAAGHALFGTGEPPATSGILANEWWHRDLAKPLKAVEDVDGSVSAKWLRVPGIADVLAAEHPRAKAVAVSLKDRAAVLPLGHAGTPIWYDASKIASAAVARRLQPRASGVGAPPRRVDAARCREARRAVRCCRRSPARSRRQGTRQHVPARAR